MSADPAVSPADKPGLRIAGATMLAWVPSGFAVVAAAADWNAYIVLVGALAGLVTTATLAAFAWEVTHGR